MTVHTFPLSRAHNIADRLRTLAEAKQAEAVQVLQHTTVQHAPTAAQIEALKARGARALEQVNEAREALQAMGAIRTALAAGNAKAGVTELLAQVDAKQKEVRLLDALLAVDLVTMVGLDQAGQVIASAETSRYHGLQVNVVGINALDALRETRSALKIDISALSDRVRDLNGKHTISVELSDALSKALGL